jgi:hypothetical protein
MFRFIVRIVQAQILLLCIFLLCSWIAGPQKAVFWFALVALTLLALTVTGRIVRRSR